MREALIVGRSDILYLLLNPAQHCNVSHPAILGYHYTSLYNLSCSLLAYFTVLYKSTVQFSTKVLSCSLLHYSKLLFFTVLPLHCLRKYDTAAPAL